MRMRYVTLVVCCASFRVSISHPNIIFLTLAALSIRSTGFICWRTKTLGGVSRSSCVGNDVTRVVLVLSDGMVGRWLRYRLARETHFTLWYHAVGSLNGNFSHGILTLGMLSYLAHLPRASSLKVREHLGWIGEVEIWFATLGAFLQTVHHALLRCLAPNDMDCVCGKAAFLFEFPSVLSESGLRWASFACCIQCTVTWFLLFRRLLCERWLGRNRWWE